MNQAAALEAAMSDPRNVVGRADGERGRRPGPRGLLLRRTGLTNNHE